VQKLLLLAAYCNQDLVLPLDALCQVAQHQMGWPQMVLAFLKASLLMSQAKFLLEWLLKFLWVQRQRHQPYLLVRLLVWLHLLLEWLRLALVKQQQM
jgi:hypothetical protein